jgi:hypothetical protein
MASERFDAVLHTLASATSRRGALGVLAGATGFGAFGLAWHSTTEARKKKKKRKPKPASCRVWVLAGAEDPNAPDAHIRVDDDLTVSVNGQVVAKDDNGMFTEHAGPFVFSAQTGDQLRIVATDVQAGAHELGALYLRCAGGGTARKLSDGFPRTEQFPQPAGTFFDETFTI